MSRLFEELDYRQTPLGELYLRRRRYLGIDVGADGDVYEVKLGEHFLMSSLFTASEEALGRLGVQYASRTTAMETQDPHTHDVDVVVGGLGLGFTAAAVLESPRVRSLVVVEYLQPVIDWHRDGLLPVSATLTEDPRCRIVAGDFFAWAASEAGFDPDQPGRKFDAVLADIDHTPESLLAADNASFYQEAGLQGLQHHLVPGGVFGLWSNDPPQAEFRNRMAAVFAKEWAEPVTFFNPLQDREATQTVYLGVKGDR